MLHFWECVLKVIFNIFGLTNSIPGLKEIITNMVKVLVKGLFCCCCYCCQVTSVFTVVLFMEVKILEKTQTFPVWWNTKQSLENNIMLFTIL